MSMINVIAAKLNDLAGEVGILCSPDK